MIDVLPPPASAGRRASLWLVTASVVLVVGLKSYAAPWGLPGWHVLGWPLLAVMVASTVHSLRRHQQIALIVLSPVLAYYLIRRVW